MPHRDITVVLISGPEPMEIWEKRLVNNIPTICYWTTVREYLLTNCRFIRGQRVGHWPLTLNSCNELCPWFFAFGHTNYARWLSVLLKNVAKLPEILPAVHDAFMEGMCVVQRGDKKCYCGSSRYGSSYTYHKTSACQYFWRVHTYAAETFSAVDRIWNRENMQRYSNPSHFANQMLGPQHCEVLPFFHAFTGCYLVSSMLGIGKKTAWNAWNAYLMVTNTVVAII